MYIIEAPLSLAGTLTRADIDSRMNAAFLVSLQGYSPTGVAAQEMLGQAFSFAWQVAEDPPLIIHGYISSMETWLADDAEYFTLQLRPWSQFLETTYGPRRFYRKNVIEIFEALCQEHGFQDYEICLSAELISVHDHYLQDSETDWVFIERIFAEQGLLYYFRHETHRHILVITDLASFTTFAPSHSFEKYPETLLRWSKHVEQNSQQLHWVQGLTNTTGITLEKSLESEAGCFWIRELHYEIQAQEAYQLEFTASSDPEFLLPPLKQAPPLAAATGSIQAEQPEKITTNPEGEAWIRFPWETGPTLHKWVPKTTPIAGHSWGILALPRGSQLASLGFVEAQGRAPVVLGMLAPEDAPALFPDPYSLWITGYRSPQQAFYFQDAPAPLQVVIEVASYAKVKVKRHYQNNISQDYQARLGQQRLKVGGSVLIQVQGSLCLQAGPSSLCLAPGHIEISGPLVAFCPP